jgi:hypothetical protein
MSAVSGTSIAETAYPLARGNATTGGNLPTRWTTRAPCVWDANATRSKRQQMTEDLDAFTDDALLGDDSRTSVYGAAGLV